MPISLGMGVGLNDQIGAAGGVGDGLTQIAVNGEFETGITGWVKQGASTTLTWNGSGDQTMTVVTPAVTTGAYHLFSTTGIDDYLWIEGESLAAPNTHTVRLSPGPTPTAGIAQANDRATAGVLGFFTRANGGTDYNVYLRHTQAQTIKWDNVRVYHVRENLANSLEYDNQLEFLSERATLTNWTGSNYNAGTSKYTPAGKVFRDILTVTLGWTVTDGGPA